MKTKFAHAKSILNLGYRKVVILYLLPVWQQNAAFHLKVFYTNNKIIALCASLFSSIPIKMFVVVGKFILPSKVEEIKNASRIINIYFFFFSLKLEIEKLASDKTDMQRAYVMVNKLFVFYVYTPLLRSFNKGDSKYNVIKLSYWLINVINENEHVVL